MSWQDLSKAVVAIVAAVGGTSAIVVACITWLGKVWMNRIQEADKAKHARDLEHLKKSLDLAKAQAQRNSDAQFKLYGELWTQLQDLRWAGNDLWEIANPRTLENFIVALVRTRRAVEVGRLILEDTHYYRLQDILRSFENFQIGKTLLLKIHSREELESINEMHDLVSHQIAENRKYKEDYERLLVEIIGTMRGQLGLTPIKKSIDGGEADTSKTS